MKQKVKPKPTIPVLICPDVKMHVEKLHWKFFIVTIDKASDNFVFICRKYCIFKVLAEVTLNGNKNSTSTDSQTKKYKKENNIKYCKKLTLK